MADDLIFPRLIYRGAPDTLGTGNDAQGHLLDPISETKRCESQDAFDHDVKDGWRLTRELEPAPAATRAPDPKAKK